MDMPAPSWTNEVVRFLSSKLPRFDDREGWDHVFISSYEAACDVLVAFGFAEAVERGAVPRKVARPAEAPPRWDDVSVAVLDLAAQCGAIIYYCLDGKPPRSKLGVFSSAEKADELPNIAPACRLGPARADTDTMNVLRALGLVADDRWTELAEMVFWRLQPAAWEMDVSSDPRFIEAVEQALLTMPLDVRAVLEGTLTVGEDETAAAMAERNAAIEERRRKLPGVAMPPRSTAESTRERLEFMLRSERERLFGRRWRMMAGLRARTQSGR